MTYETILFSIEGGIARLTLNRGIRKRDGNGNRVTSFQPE